MRVNDAVIGAVLLVLSLAVVWHVRSFPTIPGQPYGAALYPFLIGCGLGICSLLLIAKGFRSGIPIVETGQRGDADDAPSGHRPVAFVTTLLALLFYLLFAERLGFLVSSTLMLIALFLAYGVRRVMVVPLAVIATLVIHYGFYKLLKVPLPWGLLESFAW
ncbi:MAG TPA: tripartite tricarboxylate transporter TctB family protein [Burkholderiaceae bacterium]|nr:tripartite tricarboxylate transporter TctB family protein [Burkholderiaceae bacterium]